MSAGHAVVACGAITVPAPEVVVIDPLFSDSEVLYESQR